MYITQMNCPNFRVLSDFRKNNSAFFHDYLKQTVQLAMELQLASLGHISLDGSKPKANNSKHKAMSYKQLNPPNGHGTWPPHKNERAKRLDRSLPPTFSQWEREIKVSLRDFHGNKLKINNS